MGRCACHRSGVIAVLTQEVRLGRLQNSKPCRWGKIEGEPLSSSLKQGIKESYGKIYLYCIGIYIRSISTGASVFEHKAWKVSRKPGVCLAVFIYRRRNWNRIIYCTNQAVLFMGRSEDGSGLCVDRWVAGRLLCDCDYLPLSKAGARFDLWLSNSRTDDPGGLA